jgi:hypothetical protein
LFDNAGTFAWANECVAGAITDNFADDGRQFTRTNDFDDNLRWTFQANWHESDGLTLDSPEIDWDNVRTEIIFYTWRRQAVVRFPQAIRTRP